MASDTPTPRGPVYFKGTKFEIEAYFPPSTYDTFGVGIDPPLLLEGPFSVEKAAIAFVEKRLELGDTTIQVRKSFSLDVIHHVYIDQVYDGIPFSNVRANVAFNLNNKVIVFGSSLRKLDKANIAPKEPKVLYKDAIETAEGILKGNFIGNLDDPPKFGYLVTDKDSAILAFIFQIGNEVTRTSFEVYVDAHSRKLVSVRDLVSRASYRVLPIQRQRPEDGFDTLVNPADVIASPRGWHSTGPAANANFTTTEGNNATVFRNDNINETTQQSGDDLVFTFLQDPAQDPAIAVNLNAARVNAFYVVNTMHDITYRYGFNEGAGSYQEKNFVNAENGPGRLQVRVHVGQGGWAQGNGEFRENPARIELYTCTQAVGMPHDAAFANDIIAHEFIHAVIHRIIGVFFGTEAAGLEEGLCDAMAYWVARSVNANVPNYVFGQHLTPNGMRSRPYSTDLGVNNLRYANIADLLPAQGGDLLGFDPHPVGEVWASILYDVYAGLVDTFGFSVNARTDPTDRGNRGGATDFPAGNIVFLRLFMVTLPMLGFQPTFVTARAAWIQADATRYGGVHEQVLREGFARRGLGQGAANHQNNYNV